MSRRDPPMVDLDKVRFMLPDGHVLGQNVRAGDLITNLPKHLSEVWIELCYVDDADVVMCLTAENGKPTTVRFQGAADKIARAMTLDL